MAKPRPKAAKGYQHAVEFQPGEVIKSISTKKEFEITSIIGSGGFGLIYKAKLLNSDSKSADSSSYAIKIEPQDNGPLFNESHVLHRIARPEIIDNYVRKELKTKSVRPLGIPHLIGNGIHTFQDAKYRFIVLPLLDVDLQKIYESNNCLLEEKTVYGVAVRLLDILEYLDFHGYVHSDLKAANILIRYGKKSTDEPSLVLIDYGLATRYHNLYKPLKKNAHNGTLEYTSIDAHDGADPSRRGDLQSLGFCLWEWLSGSLPWKSCLKKKDDVKAMKIKCLKDLEQVPTDVLKSFFKSIVDLEYDEKPNYNDLKDIFLKYLKKNRCEKLYIPPMKKKSIKKNSKPMRVIQNESLEKMKPPSPKKRKVTRSAVKKLK